MDVSQIVAVAVFVVVMITIMTEKLHRSLAAITGAMIVLALPRPQHAAVRPGY